MRHRLVVKKETCMRLQSVLVMLLLGTLSGCWWPREAAYSPAVIEHPLPVEFFYGTIVDVRTNVNVEYYGQLGHAERLYRPRGADALFIPLGVLDQELSPNLPAVEYTVMLDGRRISPDSYMQPQPRPAIIVVQNFNRADREDALLGKGARVFVRVIGNTGHVFPADRLLPGVEPLLKAPAPMPVPLDWRPPPPPAPPPTGCAAGSFPRWSDPENGEYASLICNPLHEHIVVR
jgi:hypothetical protein